MFISLIAGVSIAATFAALGALTVKVQVLAIAVQAMTLMTVIALCLIAWMRFNRRTR